ncbi:MAG: PHP domain-containing protein [Anaerolineae bacterium]
MLARPPIEDLMAGRLPTYERPEVDCHLHTTASDGAWSPGRVVEEAHRRGLRVVAITDHDQVSGVPEALEAGSRLGITVIPAVELDVVDAELGLSAEVLGYDLDRAPLGLERMDALCRWIARQRVARMERLLARVEEALATGELAALAEAETGLMWGAGTQPLSLQALLSDKLGRPVALEEMPALLDRVSLMLPDLCRFLVHAGYVEPRSAKTTAVKEAFFAPGKPLHVDFPRLSPREAIGAIHACGGRAVLAHPGCVHGVSLPWRGGSASSGKALALDAWVERLRGWGLDGLELYFYRDGGREEADRANRHVAALADRLDLFLTFGSDCHGPGHPEPEPLLGRFGGSPRQEAEP